MKDVCHKKQVPIARRNADGEVVPSGILYPFDIQQGRLGGWKTERIAEENGKIRKMNIRGVRLEGESGSAIARNDWCGHDSLQGTSSRLGVVQNAD